ncbi:CAP domain-containing protein [Lactobacillus ultunensis]|uniref:SCP-like protein n=1 Tax=Lactobacillus ultunensis DSM 16047 TaxID=525365 RepID=C2EQ26_9LACO|nr:CAP domain-containing protein [Lactobacillus ultunensis]EEJ71390.1 SCP-like protein [Lactobacillus ultunensis DSM 16047]QQP28679.1 CAP domain-containing protein [Lactobacillus ultunensis]
MLLRKFSITAMIAVLLVSLANQTTQAATFTTQEINEVHNFQKEYAQLDKTSYSISNIYAKKPHLSKKFNAGRLSSKYIRTQINYINYYRSLFGLPAVTTSNTLNNNAQRTAAVMAAINANPFVNQHGLPSEKRPTYISKATWKVAKETSETSNLNFNVSHQSAGDVITDLITDHYNLSGSDTGHRAWLLSTRLTTTGIGAAYGSNGYRYSVQKVLNANDMFRAPSQPVITYPSMRLFPLELAKGKNIVWSVYLSSKTIRSVPAITIKDLDTGIVTNGTRVKNYSTSGYGNFKTLITYSPGKTQIIPGHEYEVNIQGIYKYTFKLFKQDATNDTTNYATEEEKSQTNPNQANVSLNNQAEAQSPILIQNQILSAVTMPKAIITPTNSNSLYDLLAPKSKWQQNFFIKTARIQKHLR